MQEIVLDGVEGFFYTPEEHYDARMNEKTVEDFKKIVNSEESSFKKEYSKHSTSEGLL